MREEERIFSQNAREGPTATERKRNMIRAKEKPGKTATRYGHTKVATLNINENTCYGVVK